MTESNWITLQNGELLLFLHKHLPFLQAKTHQEFNGLGRFLQLLDYLIINKSINTELPFMEMRISKNEFRRFGSGKHYQQYIDNFFIPDPDYFYSGEAYQKSKRHTAFIFIHSFMKEAQQLLRVTIGDDKYFKPLKVNLSNPEKIEAFPIPFASSTFLDKSLWDLFKRGACSYDEQKEFVEKLAVSSVLLNMTKDLKHYKHSFNDRQKRNIQKNEEIYTFKVTRINQRKNFKLKLPTATQLKVNPHTKIKINLVALDKMIVDAKGLEVNKLHSIKHYYKDNDNYLFYEEIAYRLYATAKVNSAPLLQGMKKEIRNKIFTGFYQYDLTASAPTILHQLYQKLCEVKELKAIEDYIANRATLRALCANYLLENDKEHYQDFEHAKKDVKEFIQAIFYGFNPLKKQSDVAMSYTNRKALIDNLPKFKALEEEAKFMFDKLYGEIAKNTDADGKIKYDKILINPYEDKLDKNSKKIKRSKASILSEIYFYHERQILDISREIFPDIVLLIHDAIILDHKIRYDELEDIIEDKLGLKIHYEEEILR